MRNYEKGSSNDRRKAYYREKKAQFDTMDTMALFSARSESCNDGKTAGAALQTTYAAMQTTYLTLTRGLDIAHRVPLRLEPRREG